MPIGGKHIMNLKPRAIRVALCLLHTLERVFGFGFRFNHRNRKRLWHIAGLNTEEIIGASRPWTTTPFGSGRFNWCRSFELELPMLIVIFSAKNRIDQIEAGFGFVIVHTAKPTSWIRVHDA